MTPPSQTDGLPARPWHWAALAALLLLAAGLRLYGLDQSGYANQYYAAAVKSMSQNGPAFFFAAFDSAGFVSVDKPPLGLWVQVWSAGLLGFSGVSLILPQALAGVLAVAATFWLTRRAFGPAAGLLAALLVALTPISVAADRNNTMDAQLVFTSLLAGWAALRAAERGRLRWLLLSAGLVGVGFNIKMLQALLIAPAVFGLYLLAAPLGWLKRLAHLSAAGLLLAALSLAWPLAVDLTPAEQRPYVGSSQNNTVLELIVGHNGLERLGPLAGILGLSTGRSPRVGAPPAQTPAGQRPPVGNGPGLPAGQGQPPDQPGAPAGQGQPGPGNETGAAGPLRLFTPQLAGQVSWFLPLALVSLAVLSGRAGWGWSRRQNTLWFWGLWLIPQVLFFSVAGLFHRYYLEMLAPAVAALAGAGLAAAWQSARRRGLWPALLAGSGLVIVAIVLLTNTTGWAAWLIPLSVSLAAAGAVGVWRLDGGWQRGAALLGLAGLILAPGAYALTPVLSPGDVALPYAGPELLQRAGRPGGAPGTADSGRLAAYLLRQRAAETFLAAALNANTAAPLILATGEPVMALGGFSGRDPILTEAELAERVRAGQVRFFLLPAGGRAQGVGAGPAPQNQGALLQWVAARCTPVPPAEWGGANAGPAGGQLALFDCARAR